MLIMHFVCVLVIMNRKPDVFEREILREVVLKASFALFPNGLDVCRFCNTSAVLLTDLLPQYGVVGEVFVSISPANNMLICECTRNDYV